MTNLVEYALQKGVQTITLYALSTENLKRPKEEIEFLFTLMEEYFQRYTQRLSRYDARLRVIGDISLLPPSLQAQIRKVEQETAQYTSKCVQLAICYGARLEIIRAVNQAVRLGKLVDERSFAKLLYTQGEADPDLIIRTGGEERLSNFLLYQAAYSELYFSKKLFPDFSAGDLDKAFFAYANRTRRFGKTDAQIRAQKKKTSMAGCHTRRKQV